MHSIRLPFLLLLSLVVAALGGACGSATGSTFTPGQDASMASDAPPGGDTGTADGPHLVGNDASGDDGGVGPLSIGPPNQTIDVTYGQQTPTVTFVATVAGQTVPASFSIDRAEIASIVAATGVLSPTGTIGGTANVTATYDNEQASTQVTIVLHLVDLGGPSMGDAGAGDGGAGGIGGVGGNGTGGPPSSTTQTVLQGTPTADPGLGWLYPYDQTVWPRGVLPPLLQWTPPTAAHAYDGIYVQLQETGFQYQGYFAANGTPFVNTLIPAAAWQALAYSNMGEAVQVTLVFSSGATAYGPLTETWKIAQGTLTGTVYYNSYGTNLAHNFCCTLGNKTFGGATLAIKHGATSPALVAGNDTECRVCHSVSANGSRLVTARGETSGYPQTSWYDLLNGYAETAMTPADGRFGFPAMYPDGTMLMNNGAPSSLAGDPASNGGPTAAQLFNVQSFATVASTGLPAGLQAGSPVFSPDGTHIAFNFSGGTVTGTSDGGTANADGKSLAAMDFDPKTMTFSNFRVLYTPPSGTSVWPSFLPTNDGVVFELEVQNNGRDWGGTRSHCDTATCVSTASTGAQGELWWVDLATATATRLDAMNGNGYLPTLPASGHTNDAVLDYEPTVNPVPSGGYAWVVFTSRRLYGNVATVQPYWSDPRYVDISALPTTKKLWVAAIDLNAKPGTDPSHPAFYLPAQELLAGNSRGYWVVDPCEQNGASCITGDQCCSGACEDTDGGFVCGTPPAGCSGLSNKCTMTSDCCGSTQGIQCIDGYCSQQGPQ